MTRASESAGPLVPTATAVARPAYAYTQAATDDELSLKTTMTASFRLDVVPGLFNQGNDALANAWRPARRLVVVRDEHADERGEMLVSYLHSAQGHGLLDDFLVVDADADARAELGAFNSVVESAVQAELGRRDVFVAFGGERTSQTVATVAVSFRRYTPSILIHRDLAATMAAVRDGVRAALQDDPVSALQRDTVVIVDEDGLLADRPAGQAECMALLALAILDRPLLDRIYDASLVKCREEGLSAILRLCRRLGPGHPAWNVAETFLTLAPTAMDRDRRQGWALLLAARVAHRLGLLPADSLGEIGKLAHWLDPGLSADMPQVVAAETAQGWIARQQMTGDDALTIPLPTGGDEGVQLVSVDYGLLEAALTVAAETPPQVISGPDTGVVASARPPEQKSAMMIRAEMGAAVPASFPVRFTSHLLDPESRELDDLLPRGCKVLAVVDPYRPGQLDRVRRLLDAYRARGLVSEFALTPVTATDRNKSLEQASRVVHAAQQLGLGDSDRIIVVGGGTVMDIAGYAAYLYSGDTPYIRIPTTLVGMIDAGIGLKVGVNVSIHKNLLGAYHSPVACVCDMGFLRSLPVEERRCGLAEAIKIGIVCDGPLFDLIEHGHADVLAGVDTPEVRAILSRSISAMLRQLEANPFETSTRRLPDFGHEFGHMLESLSRYRLRHGEAVAIGMALSCCLANRAGYLSRSELNRVLSLLRRVGLELYDPVCDPYVLWRKLHDEVLPHKAGQLHLVVPRRIGTGDFIDSINDISLAMLADVCDELRAGRLGRPE
jgi:2-epi-5-epi-valiolone synthase